MARGRQVVATVKHGWTLRDHMRLDLAEWWNRLPWYQAAMIRAALWFVRSSARMLAVVLFVAGLVVGLPWALSLAVAVLAPSAWRAHRVWRVFVYPSRDIQPSSAKSSTGLFKRAANAWTAWRRWRKLAAKWDSACSAAGLLGRDSGSPPPLLEVRVTDTGIAADVPVGSIGLPASAFAAKSEQLAAAVLGCRSVTVTQGDTPGWATMHFQWADPLSRVVEPSHLALPAAGRLTFGVTEAGSPTSISMFKSLLIVGVPGSGKSSTAWTLLASLLASNVPFRLRVIDPKGGVELHALKDSPLVRDYARTSKEAHDVIAKAYRALKKREDAMSGTSRMHKPTPEEPLEILLIDELLALPEILAKGTDSDLGRIMFEGRASAFTVWALTQIPHIDTVGRIRNLFVQKLVHATESPDHTAAVLPGAQSLGVKAHEIPEWAPGVGFASIEGVRGYQRFRSVFMDDDATRVIASGHAPPGVPVMSGPNPLDMTPHTLYAWYSPKPEMRLLYVGISNSAARRAMEHLRNEAKTLLTEPGVTMHIMSRFEGVDARAQALAAEKAAIQELKPLLNEEHQPVSRETRQKEIDRRLADMNQ